MINGDNEGLMVQENVRIPYGVKNILPNNVKKWLTFASVCIHQCSYGEINIIHILNPLAVEKQFVDQGQRIGAGDQINSIVYITCGFSRLLHK